MSIKKREVEKKSCAVPSSSVYTHSIHGGTVQQFVEPNVIVGSHFTNAYVTQVVRRGFDKGRFVLCPFTGHVMDKKESHVFSTERSF